MAPFYGAEWPWCGSILFRVINFDHGRLQCDAELPLFQWSQVDFMTGSMDGWRMEDGINRTAPDGIVHG